MGSRRDTHVRSFRDANVLWLGEEAKCFFTAFAADTAGFHTAEGNTQIAHQPAIYPDCTGVDFFRDAMRAVQILRPQARGQAVVGIIGVTDHFLFIVEWRDRDDRAEDFFAISATRDGQMGDNRRLEEVTRLTALADRLWR